MRTLKLALSSTGGGSGGTRVFIYAGYPSSALHCVGCTTPFREDDPPMGGGVQFKSNQIDSRTRSGPDQRLCGLWFGSHPSIFCEFLSQKRTLGSTENAIIRATIGILAWFAI